MMIEQLKEFKTNKSLISYERSGINSNRSYGFILECSETLILFQNVFDFELDGLRVINTKDITKISQRKTDIFHEQILKDDGTFDNIDFSKTYNLESWKSAFEGITKEHRFIIIEDEIDANDDSFIFVIGDIQNIEQNSITMLGFGTEAEWYDTVTEIPYELITTVQLESNYIKGFERYFERKGH